MALFALVLTVCGFPAEAMATSGSLVGPSSLTLRVGVWTPVSNFGASVAASSFSGADFRAIVKASNAQIKVGTTTGLTQAGGYSSWTSGASEIAFTGALSDINVALSTLSVSGTADGSGSLSVWVAPNDCGIYSPDSDHYYAFYAPASRPWTTLTAARTQARSMTCNGMSGYLAHITSAAEQSFLLNRVTGNYGLLGGTISGGVRSWLDGPSEAFSYASWCPGEPNGGNTSPVVIYAFHPDGCWDDQVAGNASSKALILEYGGVGSPTQQAQLTASLTVDGVVPSSPIISSGPGGLTRASSGTVTFAGEPSGTFECSLDDSTFAACASPYSFGGLSDGSHSFAVRQIDTAGNTGYESRIVWSLDATPPEAPSVTLLTPSSSPSSSQTASVAFSGEAGAQFGCSLDRGTYGPCSSPKVFTALADGSHIVSVKQRDAAGNLSSANSVSWSVDTTAPAAPVLSSPPTGSGLPAFGSIFFGGELGGSFNCSLDGGPYAYCTSPYGFSDLADGSHTFDVTQTDDAGNTGLAATASWSVDATPPSAPNVAVVSPGSSPSSATSASLSLSGEAGGSFECSLDGASFSACSSPVVVSSLADGVHTFAARQTDAAGNTGSSGSATWTVDTVAPAAPVLAGAPSSLTNSTSASVSFTGEAGASFTCSVDGGSYASCSSPQVFSSLADGAHSLAVKQADLAGNAGTAATASWTVDTTPPVVPAVTLLSPNGSPTFSTTALVQYSGEVGAVFECSIDSGAWTTCTGSPTSLTGLAVGSHSFNVRSTDSAGNTGSAGGVSWTILASGPPAPTATISSPGIPTLLVSNAVVTFTGGAGNTFTCSVDGGAVKGCSSPLAILGLSSGSHTVRIWATDTGGVLGPPAVLSWSGPIDNTPPQPAGFVNAPRGERTTSTEQVVFRAESGATAECSLDSASWTACQSPVGLSGLNEGAHSLSVRITDSAGNVGEVATASWVTVLPVLQVSAGPTRMGSVATASGATLVGIAGSPTPVLKWQRCRTVSASSCARIAATSRTYKLAKADIGFYVRFGVSWTPAGGSIERTIWSAFTGRVGR